MIKYIQVMIAHMITNLTESLVAKVTLVLACQNP